MINCLISSNVNLNWVDIGDHLKFNQNNYLPMIASIGSTTINFDIKFELKSWTLEFWV